MGERVTNQVLNRYGVRPFWFYGLGKMFYMVDALRHYCS